MMDFNASRLISFNLVAWLKTIVMFCVILGFGSILGVFYVRAVDLAVIISIFALMIANRSYLMSLKLVYTIFATSIIALVLMFVTHSPFEGYFGITIRVALMGLLITAFKNDYSDITKHLVKAIRVVIVLAIINFLLTLFFPMIFSFATTPDGFETNTLGYIFNYHSKMEFLGVGFDRNQGLFWEPGILQIPVNIYIYYKIIEQDYPIKKVILPILVVLSTFSTTGFIILGIILLIKFKTLFTLKGVGLFRSLAMLLLMGVFAILLLQNINRKFNDPGYKVSSMARTYDMLMAAEIAKDNPILGIGINQERQKNEMKKRNIFIDGYQADRVDRGNTNSILQCFVNFGVPLTILLLISLYYQRLIKQRFGFFLLIILALSSEPMLIANLTILLILSSVNLNRADNQLI